jgi:hypothetical protein
MTTNNFGDGRVFSLFMHGCILCLFACCCDDLFIILSIPIFSVRQLAPQKENDLALSTMVSALSEFCLSTSAL